MTGGNNCQKKSVVMKSSRGADNSVSIAAMIFADKYYLWVAASLSLSCCHSRIFNFWPVYSTNL